MSLKWVDVLEIAIQLAETRTDVDPRYVNFVDLHRWVTELPDSFGDGLHKVAVTGTSAAPHDLDLYFYDADCQVTGSAASSAADEAGTLPSGTKYVLSHLWSGAAVDIEVVATALEKWPECER